MRAPTKWQCRECNWIGTEYLTATNPFDGDMTTCYCPECKTPEQLFETCDEPDCKRQTSCGFPVTDHRKYRRTCHEHSNWKKELDARN